MCVLWCKQGSGMETTSTTTEYMRMNWKKKTKTLEIDFWKWKEQSLYVQYDLRVTKIVSSHAPLTTSWMCAGCLCNVEEWIVSHFQYSIIEPLSLLMILVTWHRRGNRILCRCRRNKYKKKSKNVQCMYVCNCKYIYIQWCPLNVWSCRI